MDIKKLLDGLSRIKIGLITATIDGERIYPYLDAAQEAIEKLRWIPVEERLPELRESVLITLWDRTVTVGQWYGHRWGHAQAYSEDVIAWMPLPYPYRPVDITSDWKQHVADRFSRVN